MVIHLPLFVCHKTADWTLPALKNESATVRMPSAVCQLQNISLSMFTEALRARQRKGSAQRGIHTSALSCFAPTLACLGACTTLTRKPRLGRHTQVYKLRVNRQPGH